MRIALFHRQAAERGNPTARVRTSSGGRREVRDAWDFEGDRNGTRSAGTDADIWSDGNDSGQLPHRLTIQTKFWARRRMRWFSSSSKTER